MIAPGQFWTIVNSSVFGSQLCVAFVHDAVDPEVACVAPEDGTSTHAAEVLVCHVLAVEV
jgi:hypothetical protein